MSKSGGKGPMRDWAASSYGPSGRAASAFLPDGTATTFDGLPCKPHNQINEARGRAEGGAPNIEGMNRSGSADPGRMIYNRDEQRPAGPPGGRHDDEHPSRRSR